MRRRGRFCWCCGRMRANEAFSGKNRRRHICRDCAKLAPEELAYRQEVRDIERLLGFSGVVRRRQRAVFQRYLEHADPRVRAYAQEIEDANERERQARRELMAADMAALEAWGPFGPAPGTGSSARADDAAPTVGFKANGLSDDDIPF